MAYPTAWPQPKKDAMTALAGLKEALRRQTIGGEPDNLELTTQGPSFAQRNMGGLYGRGVRSEYDDPLPIGKPPRPITLEQCKRIAEQTGLPLSTVVAAAQGKGGY